MQTLVGGMANDDFIFQGEAGVTGLINGGAGDNTLDYSQFAGDPNVIRGEPPTQGTARNLGQGFINIQNIILGGGAGPHGGWGFFLQALPSTNLRLISPLDRAVTQPTLSALANDSMNRFRVFAPDYKVAGSARSLVVKHVFDPGKGQLQDAFFESSTALFIDHDIDSLTDWCH
jgi:hypothetical protein